MSAPAWKTFVRRFRFNVRELLRGHRIAAAAIALTGVGSAVGFSLELDDRYEAQASLSLVRTAPDLRVQAIIDARVVLIARRFPLDPPSRIETFAQPGNPVVRVTGTARSRTAAVGLVNTYAAELVASDRGIDRELTLRRIERLRTRIEGLRSDTPAARRLASELEQLESAHVTDSSFRAATDARRTQGPAPLRHAAIALPASLLLGLAVALGLDRLARPSGTVAP